MSLVFLFSFHFHFDFNANTARSLCVWSTMVALKEMHVMGTKKALDYNGRSKRISLLATAKISQKKASRVAHLVRMCVCVY